MLFALREKTSAVTLENMIFLLTKYVQYIKIHWELYVEYS